MEVRMQRHCSKPVVECPGVVLAAAIAEPSVSVPSVHRQGIDRLAEGLSVEAHAVSDGWSRRSLCVHAAAMCWRCNGIPNGTLQPAHPAAHSFHL
ncbi:gamma-glutamyl-gamma-aminobutyrate hydrolase family protein [Sphingomonas sp. ZB1N12]|uniref:gamma-glutamyl-gamma-aminobutyrate hydrolase family protein n=1 Tax=Sphingomonas arabinosi TaxID=3096160 RepID=UPI002FC5E8DC